jgi:ferric-dicitrate binding protein FerR (iron transport regulator)
MMRSFWKFGLREHPKKGNKGEEDHDLLLKVGLTRHTLPPEDVSDLWKRIRQDHDPLHGIINKRSPGKRWYWLAAPVFLTGAIVSLYLRNPGQSEYHTAFGETKTLVLPDGSTVMLNANSHVVFHKNWEQRPVREVWLEGEAYFSVVHKQNHQPFKVSTPGGVAVEVLGTTFNVYYRAVETKVVLNSGQISLSFPVDKKEKKILMKPGELVEYKKNKYSKRVVDPSMYAAWTEKKIILNQTSLREMIQMAKDNYGVEIDVPLEKMLEETVSGSMPIGDAESFVNQVARAFQLKVVHENNKLLFKE